MLMMISGHTEQVNKFLELVMLLLDKSNPRQSILENSDLQKGMKYRQVSAWNLCALILTCLGEKQWCSSNYAICYYYYSLSIWQCRIVLKIMSKSHICLATITDNISHPPYRYTPNWTNRWLQTRKNSF